MSYKAARLAQLAAVKEQPGAPGPERVIWQITRACDLCCQPCRTRILDTPSPNELSLEEGLNLIEQLRRSGQPELQLTGGDPLKRTDIALLVMYAHRLGLPVGITLSGTPRTTPRLVGLLQAAGLNHITFCLDGPTADVHDGFRRQPGSYGWTIDGIRVAQGIGLPIGIETSVTPATIDSVDAMADMVGRLGARHWQVTFGGRPVRNAGGKLSPPTHGDAMERLAALQGTVNYRIRITPAAYFVGPRQGNGHASPWHPLELFVADNGAVEQWNSGRSLGNVRVDPFPVIVRRALQPAAEEAVAGS
ncbi:MAG: radical SAM protein [Armatimonadetes bacterium]|nr:radical SAM protein [Armatimonadota bacterium]